MMILSFEDLVDRVCVVTGGAGVIGSNLVKGLAAVGVRTAVEYVRDTMKETDATVFRDRINTLMRRTTRFRACSGQMPYSG